MLILEYDSFYEYNKYKKYLNDKKFMKYFNEVNEKSKSLFPGFVLNLELIIDKINSLYLEGYLVDDIVNKLYYDGNLCTFSIAGHGDLF